MIKFFRKIRQNLLMENKTGKYFKYAIGEIVLVVIGILIALWISNLNQERLKLERVDKILLKIQADISQDIGYSNWLISNYIERCEIKDKVFNNQFDFDNLSPSDISNLDMISYSWANLPTQTSGYNQLTAIIEDVPDDYQELVRTLDFTYRTSKAEADLYSNNMQKLTLAYNIYLINNQPWVSEDAFNNEISPTQIEYYKNNPKFKNRVMESTSALSSLMWAHSGHRSRLTNIYVSINDLLGNKVKTLPNKIRNTSLMTEHDAQKYIGTYEETSDVTNGETIEITAEGKDIYITNAEGKNRLLYFHEEKPWFGLNSSSKLFMFDGDENNTLRLISGRKKIAVYSRRISQ